MRSSVTQASPVVLVTHELFYGAAQALAEYLRACGTSLVFITHPLRCDQSFSTKRVYQGRKLISEKRKPRKGVTTFWQYVGDAWLTFWWTLSAPAIPVFVGVNPLNCFIGLTLRLLGKAERVIFYAIDFTPQRLPHPVANRLYHSIERWCILHADEVWDVSPRLAQGRKEYMGIDPNSYNRKIVPIGLWKKDIVKRLVVYDAHQMVFVGDLWKKQGVQLAIEALPLMRRVMPKAHLVIIGSGEYEQELRRLTIEHNVSDRVAFIGWVSDQRKIRTILMGSALGIATYETKGRETNNFTYYADPTKLKTYLSCGLPIIMTGVPHNAKELEEAGCARVIPFDAQSFAKAATDMLAGQSTLFTMKKRALQLASQYTWEDIFGRALKGVL